MLNFLYNSKSRTFQAVCFCFLSGILAASLLNIKEHEFICYAGLAVLIICLAFVWQNKKRRIVFILFLTAIFGIYRYTIFFPKSAQHITKYIGEEVEIEGRVTAEPDVRTDGVNYTIEAETANGRQTEGRVYFKSKFYPRYGYGDRLRVTCKLAETEAIEDFRYDMYLAAKKIFVTCSRPEVELIEKDSQIISLSLLYKFKTIVAQKINLLWNEPQASFMAGLLYGYRGGLGSLNEDFNRTGVTHIVAVSGYNITIVVTVLIGVFVQLGLNRKRAFGLIIICVIAFTLFAGASASVVRAAIMGLMVVLAKQSGRVGRPAALLLLTATAMSVINPLLMVWDSGFQLSFLSTCGLIYLTPKIEPHFIKVPERFALRESLVSTLSATIFTLPLIIYQFNRVSVVSVVVNMLVLPIIPLIMLLGFLSLTISIAFNSIGVLLAYVANLGLLYIIKTVRFFSSLPFASIEFSIPFYVCLFMYVLLICMLIRDKWPKKSSLPSQY